MRRKILFSPIGGTDPISNFRDGAFLHICRHYQPDKVYLYLSAEMCRFHDDNNRYIYCLTQLGELLGHQFEYEIIRRDDLEDVQIFDYFIEEYKRIIWQILNQEETDHILVNVSSGTPAMKSALLMLSVLYPDKILPIQVSTPEKRMNPHDEDRYKYDVEGYWSVNEDNEEGAVNRCVVALNHSWLMEVKKETIIRQIEACDYVAAVSLLEEVVGDKDQEMLHLIKAAACRLKLDSSGMERELRGISVGFIPVKEGNLRYMTEYALGLQIRLRKEEYADFVRALSPLLWDLYAIIVKKECGIDLEGELVNRSRESKNGIRRFYWDKEAVQNCSRVEDVLQKAYNYQFSYGSIVNDHLSTLIINLCQNGNTQQKTETLQSVERKVRNMAAHNVVSVTDEKIVEITGISARKIMDIIKELMNIYVLKGRREIWQSYEQMNQILIDRVRKI